MADADDWASFFERQNSFRRFREVVKARTRRLIAFCGAGASREAGLPTWDEFVNALLSAAKQVQTTAPGHSLVEATETKLHALADPWEQVEALHRLLGAQFESAVRDALTPRSAGIPTFHRLIWSLSPAALLTVNLDGFARQSYADLKTGKPDRFYTGANVSGSREIFSDDRPLIVNLHGTLDDPTTWVLTRHQYAELTESVAYLSFLQSIFTYNTVLFYGVNVYDTAISSHVSYLQKINFLTGEYFSLLKKPSSASYRDEFSSPIRPIYLPDNLSWEEGLSQFVDAIKPRLVEAQPFPVTSTREDQQPSSIPSPENLMSLTPDEVRVALSNATKRFRKGDDFDYDGYRDFCRKYDLAINHASRVRIDTSNNTWLGYTLVSDLGAGNFGKVFEATANTGLFAIKVAHESVRDSDVMLNSFRRGVSSMRKLSEAKIEGTVSLVDASELPPSIIMEYVEGVDLEKYITRGTLRGNTRMAAQIVKWVADTIFRCHTHKDAIFHRDLRPSNIMIRSSDAYTLTEANIVVLDFDLSWFKGAKGDEYYMSPSNALGYLAPEQINQQSKVSARSALVDVYGLGMLLYFVLAGDHPVANAAVRYDWEDKVEHASRQAHDKNWKSLPQMISRIISASTDEVQENRIGLQQFIEMLHHVLIAFDEGFIGNPDYILIELFQRIFGNGMYTVEYGLARAKLPSGTTLTATGDAQFSALNFDISYIDSGQQVRSNIGKYMHDALERAKSIVASFGKINLRETNVQRGGFRLSFQADLPTNSASLNKLNGELVKVMNSLALGSS